MSKHTPGPWTFQTSDAMGDRRYYISQSDGAPYTPEYSDVATLICETINGEKKAIQKANARLLSSAPELLTACKVSIYHLEAFLGVKNPAVIAMHAAIAKAEGQS